MSSLSMRLTHMPHDEAPCVAGSLNSDHAMMLATVEPAPVTPLEACRAQDEEPATRAVQET